MQLAQESVHHPYTPVHSISGAMCIYIYICVCLSGCLLTDEWRRFIISDVDATSHINYVQLCADTLQASRMRGNDETNLDWV